MEGRMMHRSPQPRRFGPWLLLLFTVLGCERTDNQSVAHAAAHAKALVEIVKSDVAEVRRGLPGGALEIAKRWKDEADPLTEPDSARRLLDVARNKTVDLSVAKSTFFALASPEGVIIRNDREQDLMAGKSLFAAFPTLAQGPRDGYVEVLGSFAEAHGVKGKPDAEWLAVQGVNVDGATRALFVTGWSWSRYAYRLEFVLRGKAKDEAKNSGGNVPLLYTFVLVGSDVYSAPESPEVNEQAVAELAPLDHLDAGGSFSKLLTITGRAFALGVQLAPDLGPRVGIGVLRSEI
jgi:hypothetical protein